MQSKVYLFFLFSFKHDILQINAYIFLICKFDVTFAIKSVLFFPVIHPSYRIWGHISTFNDLQSNSAKTQSLMPWPSPIPHQKNTKLLQITFKKVSSKPCLVHSAIRDKLHPQGVGSRSYIFRLVITAEASYQWTVLTGAISNF